MDEVAQQCERIREEHDNSDEANLFADVRSEEQTQSSH